MNRATGVNVSEKTTTGAAADAVAMPAAGAPRITLRTEDGQEVVASPQSLQRLPDGTYRLSPVAKAADILRSLLRLYARGLREPLHFFPKSAWTYVREDGNLERAEAKWKVTAIRRYTEGADPAYRLALRGVANPLDAAFTDCADTVYTPLLACIEDIRL